MNKQNFFISIFVILLTLTDTNIIPLFSVSDCCIIFFLIIIFYKQASIIPKQSIIFTFIAIIGLFTGIIINNPIQYKSFYASVFTANSIGLFSKTNYKFSNKIDINKVISYVLITLSFFTILDFLAIILFKNSLNFSLLYGIEPKSWSGYTASGQGIIRPTGIYAEPGDNTSIIVIFLSLKLYFNNKFKIKDLSFKNIPLFLGMFSIMISRSNQGTLALILIIIFLIFENLIKKKFFLKLFKRFTISFYRLKKKNIFSSLIILTTITISILYTLPRVIGYFNRFGGIDLTRAYTLAQVFNPERGLLSLILGTSFEIPDLLVNSLTQFINLFYQFGILSFILFYLMLKPAIKHSGRLFLFILMVFFSKFNISTIPFWLSIYFCEKEYNNKILNKT